MAELYRKVWAPDGRMFEVNPERASDLVLNKGWSNTPPKNTRKKRGKKVEEPVEFTTDEAVDDIEEVTGADAPEESE